MNLCTSVVLAVPDGPQILTTLPVGPQCFLQLFHAHAVICIVVIKDMDLKQLLRRVQKDPWLKFVLPNFQFCFAASPSPQQYFFAQ